MDFFVFILGEDDAKLSVEQARELAGLDDSTIAITDTGEILKPVVGSDVYEVDQSGNIGDRAVAKSG